MRDPKAVALFYEILGKTEAKKVAWQPTGAVGQFTTPISGKFILTLFPYTNYDDQAEPEGPPCLVLKDENGNVIADMNFRVEGIDREDLATLAILAKRIALSADDKLDELLTELKNPEVTIGGDLWRYDIFDDQNRSVKVSNYVYPSEQAALDAAEEYKRKRARTGETWWSNATRR